MSRQAAIRWVKTECNPYGNPTLDFESGKKVIEHLEQMPPTQPGCEDAVSRFEVLRLIDYSSHDLNDSVDNRYMQNEIKQLPSVIPKQPGWIPCSERLPDNNRQVLVYARSVHFVLAKYDEMREADGTYKMQWVTFDAWKPFYKIKEVIAWMELPKPWKGGQDENN